MFNLDTSKAKTTATRPAKLRVTKFTGALVALSVAVSTVATAPAHANSEDVAKVIGGLTALFVIGKAIESANDSGKANGHVQRKSSAAPAYPTVKKTHPHKSHITRSPRHPKVSKSFTIPRTCVTKARDSKHRSKTVALENCVMKHRRSARALPNACEVRVHTSRGRTHAYELGCLTNFGYRVSRS